MNDRVILHSDANCFYASVEMLLNPELQGKAVAVCGSEDDRHGIVLAKSEKAKRMGVKTGQANWEARQACPGLICVPPHYEQYNRFSMLLRNIYRRYTDLVEPYGMDECWLDVTGSDKIHGNGTQIAEDIRQTVKDELGITVSIGVSFSKILAKLGSDMKKPDAITVLDTEHWRDRVWQLPVSDLLFVGPRTAKKLKDRNVLTIGDLAHTDPKFLQSWFGKNGLDLWITANGEDRYRIKPDGYDEPIKSVGHGITCNADLHSEDEVWKVILDLSQDIGHRLRCYGLSARGVRVCVRDNELGYEIAQAQLSYPSQSPLEIAQAARLLFNQRYRWLKPVRAITVTGINLVSSTQSVQIDMFGDMEKRMRRQKLDDCIDAIRGRFGNYFYHLVGAGIIRVTLRTVVSDRVLYRLLAEWNRVSGSRVSGKPHWIACNRHPSAEPSGSSHWFLRGPGLLKLTCLRRFVCITDRRFSYLWRNVWQQPGSSRCTSIRGKP